MRIFLQFSREYIRRTEHMQKNSVKSMWLQFANRQKDYLVAFFSPVAGCYQTHLSWSFSAFLGLCTFVSLPVYYWSEYTATKSKGELVELIKMAKLLLGETFKQFLSKINSKTCSTLTQIFHWMTWTTVVCLGKLMSSFL